ncbi:hypothetical protein GCM10027051_12620 [Niabella terrae]
MSYQLELQIRWADLDANGHLRHSVYYDWGSYCRIVFLAAHGLSVGQMQALHTGPVLFRETALFKREILQADTVSIDLELLSARNDFSRFSIRHNIRRQEDILAAVIEVEGAWMDTLRRKLHTPPEAVARAYEHMPKAPEFEWR